jgi:hypothetical protein
MCALRDCVDSYLPNLAGQNHRELKNRTVASTVTTSVIPATWETEIKSIIVLA